MSDVCYNHIDEVVDDSLDQYIDSWFDYDETPIRQLTDQELLDMQEETADLPF